MDTCNLFDEDEVHLYNPGKGYKFGLVIENSEFISSSDEDEKPEDRLQKGTIRVAWHPSGKETVVAEDKVKLVDRSLMPGDVVRRPILGQDSQCGYVTNMDVRAHLRVLRSSKYIYNVNSLDLLPILYFESGQEVIMDSWWGRVENVVVDLIVVFLDGAKCRVQVDDLVMFDDVTEKPRHGEFNMGPHYPGQELKGPIDSLSEGKWLYSTPRYCHRVANRIGRNQTVHIVVEKVETKSVEVLWVFCGTSEIESTNTPPPKMIMKEDMKRLEVLDWFSHCSLQIGDRMLYRVKNDDAVVLLEPCKAFDPQAALNKERGIVVQCNNKPSDEPVQAPGEQAGASAVADGAPKAEEDNGDDADYEDIDEDDSDDSSEEKSCTHGGRILGGRCSKRKNKTGYKSASARLKGNKLNKSGSKRSPNVEERLVKADTVVEVETEFTTSWATVMWQDGSLEKDIPSVELFPVHHLDEHEFFPGDFVLPNIDLPEPADYGVVVTADHTERTCRVHWFKAFDVGKATRPKQVSSNCEVSVYDIKDHSDYKFRPGQSVVLVGGTEDENSVSQTVGQIFDLDSNGQIVVKWADGSISQRYPQEVIIVSDDVEDDSDNDDWISESDYESDASSTENWETESEHEVREQDDGAKAEHEDSGYDQEAMHELRHELDSLLGRAQTALDRLQKLLNSFDISVQAPECFHDILRIFHSCTDLDKILKSNFFRDAELRSLVGQAKQELKREKSNKLSRHLNQVFESWSQRLTAAITGRPRSFGLRAADGTTVKFTAGKKNASEESDGVDSVKDVDFVESQGATGGAEMDSKYPAFCDSQSRPTESCSGTFVMKGSKKEFIEPAIGKSFKEPSTERWPSDSVVDSVSCEQQMRNKGKEAKLVGENCVAKASKRVKSDGFDESGRVVKKSRDDKKCSSQVAQDLCLKICRNLQKQILLIHEEMNKRTNNLLQAAGNQSVVSVVQNEAADNVPSENTEKDLSCLNGLIACEPDDVEGGSVSFHKPHPMDRSLSYSMDGGGEHQTRQVTCAPHSTHPEQGDGVQAVITHAMDTGNEASCEEEVTAPISDWKNIHVPCKGFDMQDEVPSNHVYFSHESSPTNPRAFKRAVRKELNLFQSSLPDGTFVKGFENRLDQYSVMILGPEGTPYEDALFLFDMMLPNDYPSSPPVCHYHSFCSDRLNPNLYEDGKVCVSLLGTWSGKGTEVWTSKSNLLQVLLSIQGLILVAEPYYNEAGFERQHGTQVGEENSRMYNEMAILKTVQSLTRMAERLPTLFTEEIRTYLLSHGPRMIDRLRIWMEMSRGYKRSPIANDNSPAREVSSDDSGYNHSPLPSTNTERSCDHTQARKADSVTNTHYFTSSANKTFSQPTNNTQSFNLNSVSTPGDVGVLCHTESLSHSNLEQVVCNKTVTQLSSATEKGGNVPNLKPLGSPASNKSKIETKNLEHGNISQMSKQLDNLSLIHQQNCLNAAEPSTGLENEKPSVSTDNGSLTFQNTLKKPDFPLFPMSRGFCITLQKSLKLYESSLELLTKKETS